MATQYRVVIDEISSHIEAQLIHDALRDLLRVDGTPVHIRYERYEEREG